MPKIRSIKAQLNHAISDNCRIGESKRAYNKNPNALKGQVFSVQHTENLRDVADAFARYMKENFSDVRFVKDISEEHINAYIRDRGGRWTARTLETRIGQLRVINEQLKNTYHIKTTWKITPPSGVERAHTVRKKALEPGDAERLREVMKGSRSYGVIGFELTARCGLRAKEAARLHADNIDLQNGVLRIREGAKNGRYRDVPIRDADRAFMSELKDRGGYVCGGINEDSINKYIRKKMKEIGIDEKYKQTEHAVRKMYCKERFSELKEKGLEDREAWVTIQKEIGHGAEYRAALERVYLHQ